MEPKKDTFGEALEQIVSGIAAFVEKLKEIDWQQVAANFNAAVKQQIEDARTLAAKGWTIPGWMTLPQAHIIFKLTEDELDAFFTEAYTADDFKILNQSFDTLGESPGMAAWRPMLEEIRLNLIEGRFLITVPALLTVLEGFSVKQILKPSGANTKGTTNLAKRFAELGRHEADSIEALPWISNLAFMQNLFANSDFDGDAPKVLNRHWVLHGRTECNWRLADAFRLVNALEMLRWLEELESGKRVAAAKQNHKTQNHLPC
jgi:hypothetical protein